MCFSDVLGIAVVNDRAGLPLISHCPGLFKHREDLLLGGNWEDESSWPQMKGALG